MWLATSHLGLKIRKSASGAVVSRDGAVRTQKIEGSMWSTVNYSIVRTARPVGEENVEKFVPEIEPTLTNFVRSYLYGT